MNWRTRDKIINAICKGQKVYIKDTGIEVSVEYFGTDSRESFFDRNQKKSIEKQICHIEFITVPSKKALDLCCKYHIKKNSVSKNMELDGHIELSKLSLTPFEGKAAKILYAKEKK